MRFEQRLVHVFGVMVPFSVVVVLNWNPMSCSCVSDRWVDFMGNWNWGDQLSRSCMCDSWMSFL